jgi:hypothetical protein
VQASPPSSSPPARPPDGGLLGDANRIIEEA